MLRTTLVLLLAAGLLAGLASVGSALFTSTVTVGANDFASGTISLTTSPTTALVTFSLMAPGDKVTAPITVTNAGTLQLRYAITDTASSGITLNNQLTVTLKTGVTTCTNAGFATDGSPITGAENVALANNDGSTKNLVGDPTTGSQSGDRTLAASANEVLCFQVMLPIDSNNTFQGLSTTVVFAFLAEQTTNNP